jgi:hypothetical protein
MDLVMAIPQVYLDGTVAKGDVVPRIYAAGLFQRTGSTRGAHWVTAVTPFSEFGEPERREVAFLDLERPEIAQCGSGNARRRMIGMDAQMMSGKGGIVRPRGNPRRPVQGFEVDTIPA